MTFEQIVRAVANEYEVETVMGTVTAKEFMLQNNAVADSTTRGLLEKNRV